MIGASEWTMELTYGLR
ncbi:hypothetical protein CAEBREN_06768 [Caenorhabditis brenneri]|uniref:Uncharacterized protein n=1 Tax=Caenorhabditis brenneri TaxID=135651 RepID=G0MTF0_CAEBE|nr:hypothetical protein CAEBREN_06768 [Caenorhabditis brenneri]